MQATELKSEGLSYEYEVTVPFKEIDPRVDAKLVSYSQNIRMPGFRPGKVPLKLMKQKHGKAVLGEVLEEMVNETSKKVLDDKKLRPAMQPKIEVKEFDDGKDLIFTMVVELVAGVEVVVFKGLIVERPVDAVEDETIDNALKRLAAQRQDSKVVEGKRGAKDGDIAVIDFAGRTADDNVEQPGMAAQGHHLALGSDTFIPGFEEQLKGAKAGSDIEVKVTFPEDYGAEELAGRDAIFDVTVHELREPVEAEINDDFAKNFGLEDLEALRKAVSEQMAQEYEGQSRLKVKKQLLDHLDEKHEFDVPAGMVDIELEQITRQVEMDARQRGAESELSDEEKEELKDIAVRRVKLGLVLSEIGRNNNIQVSDAELQQAVIREAQKFPGQEKQVFDFYSKNRNALESLRAPLFEEKTVDFILELAEIKEKKVSVDELTAEDDESEAPKKAKKKASSKKAAAKESEAKAEDKPKKTPAKKKAPAKKKKD